MNRAVTFLFWLAVAAMAAGLIRRAALWRVGKPAPVRWSGLLAMPKRYLVDLHHVVARDPYIARTHVAVAGGAVATILLVAVNYGLAIYSTTLNRLIHLAALVMLGGVFFVWLRRLDAPPRLSRGPWNRLPYSLAGFAVGAILLDITPSWGVALAALLPLCFGGAELALGIGRGGPMKHAVAGLLHLAFHPRPERFGG